MSDSSHPAIVPLKDAPPITEVESHSPAPNYITVHYSKLSRYTPASSISVTCSSPQYDFVSFCNVLSFSVSHLHHLSPYRAAESTVSCLVCHRFYFTTALARLLSSLSSCHHILHTLHSLSFPLSPLLFFCNIQHLLFMREQ